MACRCGTQPAELYCFLIAKCMATEIEHKYIVTNDSYLQGYRSSTYFRQGYLTTDKHCVVRVRIAGHRAYITIKGENRGVSRPEYEVEIDPEMAQSMLDTLCQSPVVEKTRYVYDYKGYIWEIDCFHGENEGLVMAEIELEHEDESYDLPPFVGRNVTGIERYYNSCLAQRPYSMWSEEEK